MITSSSAAIAKQAVCNLSAAQKRIAETGDAKSIIQITAYLLRLTKKLGDAQIYVAPGPDDWGGGGQA